MTRLTSIMEVCTDMCVLPSRTLCWLQLNGTMPVGLKPAFKNSVHKGILISTSVSPPCSIPTSTPPSHHSCPHPSPATSHLHIGNNQNETGDWGSGRVSRSILGLQSQYTTVLAPMFYSASPYFKARFPLSISVFIYVHSTGHFGRTLPLCLHHLQHIVDSLPTTSTN